MKNLKLCAVMIDGIRFDEETFVAALGIERDGCKTILGLRQGASENATVVNELCADLEQRGLDFQQARLYVLDGAKALAQAVRKQDGEAALIQRCQLHIAGRDPPFQRGGTSPPGRVPASPVAWGRLSFRSSAKTRMGHDVPEKQGLPGGERWRNHDPKEA